MRRALAIILSMTLCAALFADDMRLSQRYGCVCHGSQAYDKCYGYELNFETDRLDVTAGRGDGKILKVTIVVPRRGNSRTALPSGIFSIGSCDSVATGAIDYYESWAEYYGKVNDNYTSPDQREAFVQCRISITKQKRGIYHIHLSYELTNGERGEYTYTGTLKLGNDDHGRSYQYMPRRPYIKNWELTDAAVVMTDTTAYSSRRAELKFRCGYDLEGYVVIYTPSDSINGRYTVRYGKEPGSIEATRGGYLDSGGYLLVNGGIDDFSTGFTYYPSAGYAIITDSKLFIEFSTRDGSTLRLVYKGKVDQCAR